MNRKERGSIRQNANLIDRLERENVRRVLLASAVSVLVLSLVWLGHILMRDLRMSVVAAWINFGAMVVLELGFLVGAYLLLRNKRSEWFARFICSYWMMEEILLLILGFAGTSKMSIMMKFLLFVAGGCLVPIIPPIPQIMSIVSEVLILGAHMLLGNLDFERGVYALVIVAFGNVAARQSYLSYVRLLTDSSRLTDVTRQAETDQMTKLLNRRGLERRISSVWPICNRQGTEVAVIMMDIDNFKKYNDSFGHGAGDTCIQKVSTVLMKQAKRTSDIAARVGGEEFLILLTGIRQEDAVQWAMECKKTIEDMQIPHARNNFLPYVSVSMGICHCNLKRDRREFWELRSEADRSLYQAKEAGRACIFMKDQMYARTMAEFGSQERMKERAFRSI